MDETMSERLCDSCMTNRVIIERQSTKDGMMEIPRCQVCKTYLMQQNEHSDESLPPISRSMLLVFGYIRIWEDDRTKSTNWTFYQISSDIKQLIYSFFPLKYKILPRGIAHKFVEERRNQKIHLCYASDSQQLFVCDSKFDFIGQDGNQHMMYNSNTNTYDFIKLDSSDLDAVSQHIESLINCPGSQYIVAINIGEHDGHRYLHYILLDEVNLKWNMSTHQMLVVTDPAIISNDEDIPDTQNDKCPYIIDDIQNDDDISDNSNSVWSDGSSFGNELTILLPSGFTHNESTPSRHPDLLTEVHGKRMGLRFAMIFGDSAAGSSKHRYLVLALSAALGRGMKRCTLRIAVYDLNDLKHPKFVGKRDFKMDFKGYSIMQHPIHSNQLIIFGGTGWISQKPFIDTFTVIGINVKQNGILEIQEVIDWDFEHQFGADSIELVLKMAVQLSQFRRELNSSKKKKLNFNDIALGLEEQRFQCSGFIHCLIGYRLYLFKALVNGKRIRKALIYDFIRNKWDLSDFTAPRTAERVIFERQAHKLHFYGCKQRVSFFRQDASQHVCHFMFTVKDAPY